MKTTHKASHSSSLCFGSRWSLGILSEVKGQAARHFAKANKIKWIVVIAASFVLSSCVTKKLGDEQTIPPNVQTYYYPKKLVWKNLILTIRNELLIPFSYASYKKGRFICKEVKDVDDPRIKVKYRLSGYLTFDGRGTVVTLYKQTEFWDEKEKAWKALPSDYLFETTILKRLEQKLKRYRRRK